MFLLLNFNLASLRNFPANNKILQPFFFLSVFKRLSFLVIPFFFFFLFAKQNKPISHKLCLFYLIDWFSSSISNTNRHLLSNLLTGLKESDQHLKIRESNFQTISLIFLKPSRQTPFLTIMSLS